MINGSSKCPVCGNHGASTPVSGLAIDRGYCFDHFPSRIRERRKTLHPPIPKGNTLNCAGHVDRLVLKGELTFEEGEKYKRKVRRDGVRREITHKSSK